MPDTSPEALKTEAAKEKRRNELVPLLVNIYGFNQEHAAMVADRLMSEQVNRESPDDLTALTQLNLDSARADRRAEASSKEMGQWANTPSNFHIPMVSTAGEGINALLKPLNMISQFQKDAQDKDKIERLSGAKMLKDVLMARDLDRAAQEEKDRAWVQMWGAAHRPQHDSRGMIIPGSAVNMNNPVAQPPPGRFEPNELAAPTVPSSVPPMAPGAPSLFAKPGKF